MQRGERFLRPHPVRRALGAGRGRGWRSPVVHPNRPQHLVRAARLALRTVPPGPRRVCARALRPLGVTRGNRRLESGNAAARALPPEPRGPCARRGGRDPHRRLRVRDPHRGGRADVPRHRGDFGGPSFPRPVRPRGSGVRRLWPGCGRGRPAGRHRVRRRRPGGAHAGAIRSHPALREHSRHRRHDGDRPGPHAGRRARSPPLRYAGGPLRAGDLVRIAHRRALASALRHLRPRRGHPRRTGALGPPRRGRRHADRHGGVGSGGIRLRLLRHRYPHHQGVGHRRRGPRHAGADGHPRSAREGAFGQSGHGRAAVDPVRHDGHHRHLFRTPDLHLRPGSLPSRGHAADRRRPRLAHRL